MCPADGDGEKPDNVIGMPQGKPKANGSNGKRDDGSIELPDNVVELPREMWRRPNFLPTDLALMRAALDSGVRDDFRFSRDRKDWRMWDGMRWVPGAELNLAKRVGDLLAEIGTTVRGTKAKSRVESAAVMEAVERKLRSELFKAEEEFDADAFVLNTPAGTVVLEGERPMMRPHRREDYITMLTRVAPGGECPGWLDFLDWMMRGDAAMIAYLQRLCGYILCGTTREQVFVFLYGRGSNGKSVFMKVIADILGSYAITAGMNTFVESLFERHPEELARMKGKRLVVASETDEGKRWNEALMKRLTGHGEKITARAMRENSFEFEVQATIVFAGNHQPELANVDPALARRIHMVPCLAQIAGTIDRELANRLLTEEAGGILQWMIDGFALWLRDGLNPPDVIKDATADYLDEQDWKSDWLRETFEREPLKTTWLSSADVFTTMVDYCKKRGLQPPSIKTVSAFLIASGWEKRDRTRGRGFVGWWYSNEYLATHPHLTSGQSVRGGLDV